MKLKPGANEHNISKFDLTLTATETEGKLHLNFEYSTSLFEGETIDRFMSYFGLLVKAVIADADRSLSELDMLPEGERYQLLYGFNDTATDYPKDRTITDLFEEQVEKTPDHVAVVNEGKTVTYRQLLERVNQITDFLGSRSTGGDIIAVFADRTIDTIASMIAILKNGSAYLPVDIKLPAERVRYMLNDAEVKIILTNVAIPEEIRREYIVHDISLIETEPGTYVEKPVRFTTSEDVAYVMYTSGTTGLPKGVMISNRNISGLVINSDYVELNETTRILLTGMLSFDATTFEIWGSLLNGGAVYLFPEDTLLDTEQLGSIMESCEINTMFLTTALYNFHVQEKVSIFKGLKYLLVGGEVLSPYHINRVHDLYPSVHLINCYGPTENTTFSVCHSIVERYEQHIPIGKPISNTTAYILDENYNPVPIGVCGELYVGGSGVARGYLNNADLSSEKFVSDPYRKGDRMYRTGDLGRWRSDGTIEFLGRRDDQVKIRGHRIEPGEIAVHVNGYAGIGDAVVQVRERGGEKYLVCYYVSSDVIREDDLQEYLSFRLPEYMIPGRYIRLESIPLTSSGKVDRKKLPEPEIINVDNYIAPANAVEEKLVEIWSEVLQIDKGVISTDSVFFRLGGHSLKAMALANKISRQLHVEVPLKEIFLRQDIRGLCAFIQGSSNSGYSGISKADAAESYPLSSSQKRMYFLYEFDKLSVAYNMPVVLELEGELDLRRISGAFGGLISRHESLRTTFGSVNGQVAQRIHAASGFNLEWYESEGVDAGPVIRRFIRPFELERGPLFRAGVVRRGQSSHLLLVDMHHIITDGVSQGILIRDFMSLYNNEVLPELRLEYKDYSVWQQGPAQQERLLGQRDFWKGEFSEGVSLLNLPCDHPRPAVKSYQGSNRSFMLDAEDTSGLRQLGEGSGATLFMTVLSVFNVFLSKLSNEEDITVGTATAGRYHAELEGIIGLFVNTLALRNQATGSLSFREFLSVVKERTLSCFDNQLYPYEELINELELSRDTSRSPLFDVMFSYQNFGHKDLEIPGLKLKPGANEHNISKFDLTLTATETEGKLHLNFEYSTSLFEGETIDRFMSYFGLLVKAVIADADRSLSELDMLPEGERYQLLYGFNDTATDYPKDRTITDLFEEQVEKTPDHVAVVFKEEQLTYKALNEKSNQLARYLLSAGIVPGNVVGLLLNRSLEMAIGIIGILKAGAIYMPIEPSLPEQRIKYMLDQSGTRLLLTHDQYLGQNYTDCRVMDINSAAGYGGNKENLYVKTGPEDLAYCIFTSGSTGLPKGVMVGNQSVVNLVTGLEKKVYKYYNDKPLHVALLASCIFDVSLQPIFGSLLLGHCLYICDEQDRKDGNRLIDFYNNNDIDLSDGTPTHLRLVVESLDKKINLKSLSSWILAGEILPKELVREFYDRIGDREIKLFDFYGPTETCVYSTCFEIIRDELDAYPTIPIGSPLPNERIYITDKYGSLTPTGVAGELCIAGDGLAKCYVGNAGLTSEKFREDWISNGERVYRTGDLARWLPDGNIEYLGRTDSQVKIRGYRIELGEIESWLTGYEGIKNAVVLVKEKDENKYLAAYFISEKDIKPEMLRNYLAEHLPEYMLPAHYVRIDSMPLTSSGKIDRNAFPEIGLGTSDNYIAPANAVEEKLAEIWSEVLQIDKGVISTDSGFFRLGGHSLKAMALANKISRQLHVEVPLKEIFLRQDIRGLCAFIQGSSNSGYSGISKADAAESYPLSSSQKRMYFLYEFDKLSVAYNMPVVLELEGELDHRRISGAFGGLISRHESLRTTFESVNGQVAQRIHAASGFNLEWYESEGVDAGPVIRRFIRPFELERGPLFRAGVVRRGQSSHLLLVDMHHIITDGVSQGILIRDFMSLYNNEVLPELRLEYKDYSVWQQGPAQQERLLGQRDFWKGEFSEGVSLLNLPCDHPRPAVKSYQGSNRSFMLDAEDTSGLRQLGEGSGATLFMTVLSVFNVFLSKLSNEEDITVGTATAGRYHAELEGIIGLFVNTLALRNQASGSLSFREFLSVVKERTLSCFDNQLYTYEELINQLELPRDTSRSPLFDVMFSYQNFGHKDLEIPGLKLKPGANEHNISKFDLTLTATETEGKLHLNFEYSTSLFEAETIDRFMSYFGLLVKAVIADADRSLSELDMLPEGERYQLLYGFNDTATDYPKDRTITDLFEEQVEKTPDHVAVVFKEEQLTYKALNEKSNQLARYLLSAGIVPGNVVGLLLNRSLEMAIGIIGILKAGAIYMPIEPSLPEQRIKYMLDQSGTRLLLTHDQYLGRIILIAGSWTLIQQPVTVVIRKFVC
ncbi:amino acid adenylation domain-containing protein [Mucilaginibacter sp. UC70_90]